MQARGGYMPSANELLWGFVLKKPNEEAKYAEALALIQSNLPDLDLNEIHKIGRSFLTLFLSAPSQQHPQFLPLVQAIIQSDKFTSAANHVNPKTNRNAFAVAIELANPALIEILFAYAGKIDVIFSGPKLQYTIVQDVLKSQRGLLTMPDHAERAQVKILALEKISAMVRDNTIRHAISTDNPDLMQALEAAGGEPYAALSDGSSPITLSQPGSKVRAWLEALGNRAMASLSTNINSFSKVLAERNAAAVAYHVGAAEIYERAIDKYADLTNRMATAP